MNLKRTALTCLAILCLWGSGSLIQDQSVFQAQSIDDSSSKKAKTNEFNDKTLFPGWNKNAEKVGMLGRNGGDAESLKKGESRGLLFLLPEIVDVLMITVGPMVVVMCLWSGILFIVAQGSDEDLAQAKKFFLYAVMGFLFIAISYSVVKIATFIIT